MKKKELIDKLKTEHDKPFTGWDFSYLTTSGRMQESATAWNYRSLVEGYMSKADSLLDMGTGGGEFLCSLQNLPDKIFATEGYEPNLEIASKNLKKINASVKFIDRDNKIPWPDEKFDLVINRHEEFDPSEVYRVLKPGRFFLTQQVSGINDLNLNTWLGADLPPYLDWSLSKALEMLLKSGFTILDQQESLGYTRFFDVGAICYYLKCIPWQIEDFTIEKYQDKLMMLHEYLQKNGFIDLINHRFLVIARKPKTNAE